MALKQLILLIFLVGRLLSQHSDTTGTNQLRELLQGNLKFEYQNWIRDKLSFPLGTYYQYKGRVDSPELIIGFLVAKGITVKEIWYRDYDSSCGDSSPIRMQVIVPSSFLIRIGDNMKEDFMNSLGFERATQLSPGQCPYSVRHYVLE
jgi:hypothetical protein